MRGKVLAISFLSALSRITPAHAGKSMDGVKKGNLALGSPPHMRGKVGWHSVVAHQNGITPAHAGKSTRTQKEQNRARDHPRTCGEKRFNRDQTILTTGSPPHMRGKVHFVHLPFCDSRITPAHAGKRLKRSRSIVPHAAIVPLFPSVCNKPAGSDGSPAGHDAPPFLPIENAAPASPAYNLRSL